MYTKCIIIGQNDPCEKIVCANIPEVKNTKLIKVESEKKNRTYKS